MGNINPREQMLGVCSNHIIPGKMGVRCCSLAGSVFFCSVARHAASQQSVSDVCYYSQKEASLWRNELAMDTHTNKKAPCARGTYTTTKFTLYVRERGSPHYSLCCRQRLTLHYCATMCICIYIKAAPQQIFNEHHCGAIVLTPPAMQIRARGSHVSPSLNRSAAMQA